MDEKQYLNSNQEISSKNNETIKNNPNFGEIKLENFEDSLTLSDIAQDGAPIPMKEEKNFSEDFSEDLDNIKEDEFSPRKISDCSIQSDEFKNGEINLDINTNDAKNKKQTEEISRKYTRKITKEELDNIPLPVFSCIYCSNMIIAFKHLSQEIVTNKYLFQTSIYDIKDINKLIIYQPLIDKDKKNEKLLNIIIKSTEYLYYNYNQENIKNFFCSKNYLDICNNELLNHKKYFTQKIEESIVKKKKDFYFKGIKNIPKNSLNNRGLFNSTNSLINNYNALSGFVENNNNINCNINMNKNNNTNNSNLSINFNSISLNNNEIGNGLYKDNNNLLVSIVEHIENNNECQNELEDKEEFMDLLELDEEKKISRDNIIWDKTYYDIWNPVFSEVDSINDNMSNNNDIINEDLEENYFKCEVNDNIKLNKKNTFISRKRRYIKNIEKKNKINDFMNEPDDKKNYKLKVNLLKSKTSNNSINFNLNQKLSGSQFKSFGSTNSSTMINFDNDCKIKSVNNLSNIKDISNNSQILIHVNTLQESENFSRIISNNSSMIMNNKDKPSKSQNFFHGLKKNKVKNFRSSMNVNNSCTFHPNINKPSKKLKNYKTNKNFFFNNNNYFNFKIHNNYDISNIINSNKYNKIKFKEKKIMGRNKINMFNYKGSKNKNMFNTSKTIFNVNSSITKPTLDYKTKIQTPLTHITNISNNNNPKKISSKIIFNQNYTRDKNINKLKISLNNNNNIKQDRIKKRVFNYQKKINLSQLSINRKEKEKLSMEKIRQKIAEFSKHIKTKNNNYNTNLNNKMKTSIIKNNGQYTIANNTNFFGKKKLCLSNSFLLRPKSKFTEKNNIKKVLFFKNQKTLI